MLVQRLRLQALRRYSRHMRKNAPVVPFSSALQSQSCPHLHNMMQFSSTSQSLMQAQPVTKGSPDSNHQESTDGNLISDHKDHRRIGTDQALFTFSPLSPGSPIFLPHGQRILSSLKKYLRAKYSEYGYEEVSTPLIFNKDLWIQSGHWENFHDDMYTLNPKHVVSPEETMVTPDIGLKPMNCPGHCLIFNSTFRTYRDLPFRIAEFSALHRNEASGALTGLTRVRTFHQDDAHIFCRPDQVAQEIQSTLEFVRQVYTRFGFSDYKLFLSTRPEKFLGTVQDWDTAEKDLTLALNSTGREWQIRPQDGAFYGPKIDILVQDAHGREHQTATIQLDFQLPQRFDLKYQSPDHTFAKPVIIHRAILGSLERMLAILIEHYQGNWPFWLSPRQVMILPVHATTHSEYAQQVLTQLKKNGYYVDVDASDQTLSKRLLEAQRAKYNYVFILGDREVQNETVTIRSRESPRNQKSIKVDELKCFFDSQLVFE